MNNLAAACCLLAITATAAAETTMDQQFQKLADQYVDEFTALSPVGATSLGDHRFDSRIDEISQAARDKEAAFYREMLDRIGAIDADRLSRANQVDCALLENELKYQVWQLEELQEWAWNPLVYTRLCGSAVYELLARDFAPIPKRLANVADRLQEFPRVFRQIRATLEPSRVPRVHAETAIDQNRGLLTMLDEMVRPQLGALTPKERDRMLTALDAAKRAIDEHQKWLEGDLLPNAGGDFRLGRRKFEQKLAYVLQSPLTPTEIRRRAERELRRVRSEMYDIAKDVYQQEHRFTQFPAEPTHEYQQAIIRAALEVAYRDKPSADDLVETVKRSLAMTTQFVREQDLITIPPDPVEIIVMPEFRRGVSLAYCDSPGPLDVGQKTFYGVAPFPRGWDAAKVESMLREYNLRSIHNLTVHEAMPGHFVQLAHSSRYKGKLRAVLSSGTFIEGWAVYTERVMVDAGLLDGDPLMRLIVLKWYLRAVANAILDQAIHTDGISREQAMRLMMEDTFQEEREAAGKWIRAQLTSAQLSTYFVGYQEHADLRKEVEQGEGDRFSLKSYHDKLLSFGSPPVQYVRALMLEAAIPDS